MRPQPWTNDLPALQRAFGIDELRPSLKRHDIGATVVVQTVAVARTIAVEPHGTKYEMFMFCLPLQHRGWSGVRDGS